MPGILKWLTALCLVPPLFVVGTLIPNGTIRVDGRLMANSDWWACGAGATVVVVAIMTAVAALLLVHRSKYGRPVFLVSNASTYLCGPLITKLTGSNATEPLWLAFDLIPICAIGLVSVRQQSRA